MKDRRRGPGKPECGACRGAVLVGGRAPTRASPRPRLRLGHKPAPGQERLTAGCEGAVIYRGDLVTVYT